MTERVKYVRRKSSFVISFYVAHKIMDSKTPDAVSTIANNEGNSEMSRIPSPSSVSLHSVNSLRPLEWDSGADVGYNCTSSNELSTLERIALAQRSACLLTTFGTSYRCKSENMSSRAHAYLTITPLAESSALVMSKQNVYEEQQNTHLKQHSTPEGNSTSHLQGAEHNISSPNSQLQGAKNFEKTPRKFLTISGSEYYMKKELSKYGFIPSATFNKGYSRRKLNFASVGPKAEFSSSSACTVSPVIADSDLLSSAETPQKEVSGSNSNIADMSKNNSSNKDYNNYDSINDIPNNGAVYSDHNISENVITKTRSALEELRDRTWGKRLGRVVANESDSCDSTHKVHSFEYFSGSDSFKYLSGSAYECRSTTTSISSLNDANSIATYQHNSKQSEVPIECAINLLTEYIEKLNISNRSQVFKKIGEALIKNYGTEKLKSDDTSRKRTLQHVSNKVLVQSNTSSVMEGDSAEKPAECNIGNDVQDGKIADVIVDSSNSVVSSASRVCASIKLSDECVCSESISEKETYQTELTGGDKSDKSIQCTLTDVTSSASEISSKQEINDVLHKNRIYRQRDSKDERSGADILKEYLSKERETQLMWIQSGISHLYNLKKLYEEQKSLQRSRKRYKSTGSSQEKNTPVGEKTVEVKEQRNSVKQKVCCQHKLQRNKSAALHGVDYKDSSSTMDVSNSSAKKKYPNKRRYYIGFPEHSHCRSGDRDHVDISKEILHHCSHRKDKHHKKSSFSYTIRFRNRREHVAVSPNDVKIRKNNLITKERTNEDSHFSNLTITLNSKHTLQDYLARNRPDFIHHAELRRQCLTEIAYLRELRDKSKKELLTAVIKGERDDINLSGVENEIPLPPLVSKRIFDQRCMRRRTERMYRRLPEVLHKMSEERRQQTYQMNRIMAKVFTKKLQKRALKGQVNLSNSVSVTANR